MIFFRHPRVKFALFFYLIRDNLAKEKKGTKAIKLNISQTNFSFLGVILTFECKPKVPMEECLKCGTEVKI